MGLVQDICVLHETGLNASYLFYASSSYSLGIPWAQSTALLQKLSPRFGDAGSGSCM